MPPKNKEILASSVWVWDGSEAKELISEAKFKITDFMDNMTFSDGSGASITFEFDKIVNFEQLPPQVDDDDQIIDDGPVQFGYSASKAKSVDTYGFHFTNAIHAHKFRTFLNRALEATADTMFNLSGALYIQEGDETWRALGYVSGRLLQRKSDKESFLVCVGGEEMIVFESLSVRCHLTLDVPYLLFCAMDQREQDAYRELFKLDCKDACGDLWDVANKLMCDKLGNRQTAQKSTKMSGVETIAVGQVADDVEFDLGHADEDDDVEMTWDTKNSKTKATNGKGSGDVRHKFMAVGEGRTFVCREDATGKHRLDVYRRLDDGRIENSATVAATKLTYKNEAMMPKRAMLHDGGTKLLVRAEGHPTEVFLMDIEREKVVQSWDSNELSINELFPTFKGAQVSADQSFRAANASSIFTMDTRLEGVARVHAKIYTKSPQFTCAATDLQGHILMGSRLGELKLFDGGVNYDSNFKQSKTNLEIPGKEPITAVEVTEDGSWIVATTRAFLVAFPVRLASSGRTGFETALGQNKPMGRVLSISAADLSKHGIKNVSLMPAKFSSDERFIVSSVGKYAVAWDMKTVRAGKPKYILQRTPGIIRDVDIDPLDSSVVVAYTEDVDILTAS